MPEKEDPNPSITPEGGKPDGGGGESAGTPPVGDEKKFTQADVDRIVQSRLADEKKRQDAEKTRLAEAAEKQRLAEGGQWKDLHDRTLAEFEDLKRQLSVRDHENLKLRIGTELKLPAELISRLTGSTEEELRKDAETLLKLVGPARPPLTEHGEQGPTDRVPRLSNGALPKNVQQEVTALVRDRRYSQF